MIVVLDTNVLVSALGRASTEQWILKALRQRQFSLLISTEIFFEYHEILQRLHSPATVHLAITLLENLKNVRHVEPRYRWRLIHTDPDDNKFVDCAIAGGAFALVTEDTDFNILKTIDFPPVTVLSVQEFAALMGVEQS
jgi:uncharacterized protein